MMAQLRSKYLVGLVFSVIGIFFISQLHPDYNLYRSTTWLYKQDDERYRQRLASIRTSDVEPHSKTLGVAQALYVVSLARRHDRRANIDALGRALDVDFTFIDATDFSQPGPLRLIDHIIDRVRWQRPRLDDGEATRADIPTPDDSTSKWTVAHAIPFRWSEEATKHGDDPLAAPLGISGSDYWDTEPFNADWERTHPLPQLNAAQPVKTGTGINDLRKSENLPRTAVSCWHSHIKAMREIVRHKHPVGIIFEDDIDMEWDIEQLLKRNWKGLPENWDIVYLGHCWAAPFVIPMVTTAPLLQESTSPLCTHAYALSLRGAHKILRYFRSPDFAYGRHIDQAFKDLIEHHMLKSYSFYPPLVVQTNADVSDITHVAAKKGVDYSALMDSTLERIALLHNSTTA